MSSDELGKLVRALIDVPCDRHEIVGDILARLSGREGQYWRHVYMRANQRKNPFYNVDLEVLELASGVSAKLYGQSPKRADRCGGFVPRADDPTSPFLSCSLQVTPAASWPTKTMIVQGYNIKTITSFSKLVEAAGGEEGVRSMHLLTPTQIRLMTERQRAGCLEGGGDGPLNLHGDNVFFVLADDGSLAAASVGWSSRWIDWGLWVGSVTKTTMCLRPGSTLFLRIK
ncbi:MAG: hypothetical protein AMXMBFR44_0690 [Candidatus Campbellbacteria bacterium]